MGSLFRRMVGAAKLQVATYEEVEADRKATAQALFIVLLSAVAIMIGDIRPGEVHLIANLVGGVLGWMTWVLLVWVVGVKLLPEAETRSDVGELIRTTGFAATPGILRVLGIVPMLGWLVVVVAWLWTLAAMVVGVRQALDYKSTWRAVAVCVIGFVGQLLVIYFGMVLQSALST
ncbi:MAG TPA: YIP1 family protein [Candidatus Dormibacteraeota bacterium]|nr:YIP1 family protein [Candidatus Dormibacteraeota bacterium]